MTCHSKLQELQDHLKSHDWHHAYSDDFRVWKQGLWMRDQLKKISDDLIDEGYIEEVKMMWSKHAPSEHKNDWKNY